MEGDIPRYGATPTSPLTQALKASNFSGWYMLSVNSPNAFYKLVALGLALHFNQTSKAEFQYLDKMWGVKASNVRTVWCRNPGDEKFENPAFFEALGNALIEDLKVAYGPGSRLPKAWFSEIAAGKVMDKNQFDVYRSFLGHLNVALIWYEWTGSGQLLPAKYVSATSNDPQVYVTLASEGSAHYLLFHTDLNSGQYKLGYPFYTKGEADSRIPSLQVVERPSEGEATQACILQEGEIIQLVASLWVTYGPQQLPVEAQAQQTRLRELIGSVTQLAKTCGCPLKLDTPEMARITSIQQIQPTTEPERPLYHDWTNCESFPEAGSMLNHLGEGFHYQCLFNYINTLPDPYTSVLCPRCHRELPDDTVEAVAPLVTEERRRRPRVGTIDHHQGGSTLPAPGSTQVSRCPHCNGVPRGPWFTYACGAFACSSCAFRDTRGMCPFCNCPYTEDEALRITQPTPPIP